MKRIHKRPSTPARNRAAGKGQPASKTAPADAHLGATEDQVVPTTPFGSTQPEAETPARDANREIDPSDELTPG